MSKQEPEPPGTKATGCQTIQGLLTNQTTIYLFQEFPLEKLTNIEYLHVFAIIMS